MNRHFASRFRWIAGLIVAALITAAIPLGASPAVAADCLLAPSCTVTFDANGGTGTMTPQTTNAAANLTLNTFARTGYTFAGWNTVAVGGGTAYADGASYPFTADVTLYAQWTADNHTVTFNANGGTGTMTPQTTNAAANLTLNTFARTGYTFAGWNTVAVGGGTAYADGASYPFTADVTLYAQWTADNHTVTFNANGGTGTMTPQTTNAAANLTLNTFARTGYTFAGWNTVAVGGGTAYADGASYPFTADVTLYAQWTADNHTVTFNANGGTGTMTPQTTNAAANLTLNTFARTGYTFAGWNTVAVGGGTAYADGASYPFTADVTLYAQWTADNHTVTFNANGGTGTMTPQTTNAAANLTLNTFARTGYTFAGWNTVAVGGGTAYADGASYPFTADVTLYAQWTADTPSGGGSSSGGSSGGGSTSGGAGGALQEITEVRPAFGPLSGGNQVAIIGYGFTGTTQVFIGGKAASFTVVNDANVDVIIPAGDALGPVDVSVVLSPTRGRAFAPGGYVYVVAAVQLPATPDLPVAAGTPDNPLRAQSPARGLILVSRAVAQNSIPRALKRPATPTLRQAPTVPRRVREIISLVVPGLPPGVTLTVKAKVGGTYVDLGKSTVGTGGSAQLPVFTTTRAMTLTLALVNPNTGKPSYIRVAVTRDPL